ncbi:circularly permuted type 2 ATP-grasp protein [uncultured Microbacterium sp.]|uniref:circularly permuted type 2 ATP-grasp protein n=1 Tax=uncultured Microbacterium sp. TaxID=191216 RepID=UPI0026368393|nr:circularly permuted type 2 ATP-grasp protein [uncultured Microbacterium sp.]
MSVLRDYAMAVSQPTLPFDASLDGVVARYDEVVGADGALRPAWKSIASLALSLNPQELHRIDDEITRFLADDGVSYIRPGTGAQPWQLDPMPLVIDAAGWARLDVGLAQRAELLNAILVDLYGPQTLLREGIIPAAIVLGHAGFARPVARPSATDPNPLLLSATDLGRDADGEWHVLADRTQAPSGLGFAAENRRVISQVLPDLYQEGNLHRMDPYFTALRAALLSSAPEQLDDPQIVILSPGTHSETAFDQAFLANALGFPLVQGSDLVVRDGWVWMKPSGWPRTRPTERIDVIIRRVDAAYCDPLELRGDSRLGVAGLSEAVRRGRVRLVNGLGAGVLENPALMPFLAAACEHLLGEQLRLPSAPTWWCGNPDDRTLVVSRIAAGDPSLIVRIMDAPRRNLADLSPDEVIARIEAAPHRFVGQDVLPLSQAPVWNSSGIASAMPMTFRAFTLRYGSAYRPLIGGLATVRSAADSTPTTKDVWVLKSAETDPDQGMSEIVPAPSGRSIPSLAPRALADMFWAGRYAERAEDLLRLVLSAQTSLDQHGGHTATTADDSSRVLLNALGLLAGTRSLDPEAEFRSLLMDAGRPGSAGHSISRLREAMEGVRDQLSGDTWRVFAHIDRALRSLRSSAHPHRTAESAGRMLAAMLSLYGVTANMIRDTGWRMIEAGRHLERSLQVCHLLTAGLVEPRNPRRERDVLEAVLTASESIVTHRRRYRGSMRVADVLDLLLSDQDNPRSVAFGLAALRTHLAAMPASTGSTRAERLLDHLETQLQSADLAELATVTSGRREHLSVFLREISAQLAQLSDAIGHLHFESGPPALSIADLALIELMEAHA